MEFPDLGKNCSMSNCKRLDFLPLKCDACESVFCNDHFKYDLHNCPNAYLKNVQVPICPLCNEPVPTKRGQPPDIEVSQHIDNDCQSDPAQKKRNTIFKNKCSVRGCKIKEMMPLICNDCNLNYCLKHRHSADHNCKPIKQNSNDNPIRSKAATAALFRFNKQFNNQNQNHIPAKSKPKSNVKDIQGNLSEDEALARALQQSINENNRHNGPSDSNSKSELQDIEDRMLAEAIAASQRQVNRNKEKCILS